MRRHRTEGLVKELLTIAGIEVNGTRPWDIQVNDRRFYRRVLAHGSLGLGESYMEGWWDCTALDETMNRLLRANLENCTKKSLRLAVHVLKARCFNLQSRRRARHVAKNHYDIGTDVFEKTLDKFMSYTCGYWKEVQNLEDAQEAKFALVCRKLGLQAGMKVLDIGCGFGGFAKYAAEHHNVEVVGVTNSRRHHELGKRLCAELPVEMRLHDYRDIEGKYDRIVALGCLEHIGCKNYRVYMRTIDRCLADEGLVLLQTIGSNATTSIANPWITKYIFTNGMVPSIAQIGASIEGIFVMEDWHNFGPDYDRTLMAWHARFEKEWPTLAQHYDEQFRRMWRYYLLSCAGAFRARDLQLWQIVLTRPGTPQPACRHS